MQNRQSPVVPDLIIRDLEFVYRPNFEGRQEKYNALGNRYFNAKIPDEQLAAALQRDGWNVKATKPGQNNPNPEEHVPEFYIEVTVGFNFRPPLIVFIRDGKQQAVGENLVGAIDSMEFDKIDVAIRPFAWSNESGSGIKAYLKSFYGTVTMDELAREYDTTPIAGLPTENLDPEAQF